MSVTDDSQSVPALSERPQRLRLFALIGIAVSAIAMSSCDHCLNCPAKTTCWQGTCCSPQCRSELGNLNCGDDGCGGSCGDCPNGSFCCHGTCCPNGGTCCTEECCPSTERCCSGHCGTSEACGGFDNPPNQCDLGNSTCCTPNCVGRVCGDDGCGGACGACPAGKVCDPSGAACI